jgi:hypothetical protein
MAFHIFLKLTFKIHKNRQGHRKTKQNRTVQENKRVFGHFKPLKNSASQLVWLG